MSRMTRKAEISDSAVQSILLEPIQTTEKWRWKPSKFSVLHTQRWALHASMHYCQQWLYHSKILCELQSLSLLLTYSRVYNRLSAYVLLPYWTWVECLVVRHLMIEMHVEECLHSTGNSMYTAIIDVRSTLLVVIKVLATLISCQLLTAVRKLFSNRNAEVCSNCS